MPTRLGAGVSQSSLPLYRSSLFVYCERSKERHGNAYAKACPVLPLFFLRYFGMFDRDRGRGAIAYIAERRARVAMAYNASAESITSVFMMASIPYPLSRGTYEQTGCDTSNSNAPSPLIRPAGARAFCWTVQRPLCLCVRSSALRLLSGVSSRVVYDSVRSESLAFRGSRTAPRLPRAGLRG
jgi:hypothetical protein